MNILAVGCHPDDLEIGCGGTLSKLSKDGHQVTMCVVANGNKGHAIIQPDEIKAIRSKESELAGKRIGAEVIQLDVPDLEVRASNPDVIMAMVDVIRKVKPDYIITHSPVDYMNDHLEVSKLVFDASFSATVPHYRTSHQHLSKVMPIYYMDTLAGVGFLPSEYVDITEHIEVKLEMLDCHKSQIDWLRDHDNIDFLDFVRTVSKFRGLQAGVAFAEGFTACTVWPRVSTARLLP